MSDRKGKKRVYISISSSSSEEEEEEEEHSESESEEDDSDEEDSIASISCDGDASEWSDERGDESYDENDEKASDPHDDDESHCDRVIRFLRERNNLQELSLTDCKGYLRKHGLRVTGTKEECVMRIKEYWRIKDGNGEALYPTSSFTTNCTGDVCQGDVVLFTQRVYEKFDKMTRRGSPLGKRTVAGRIVTESYGAAKQQHTFTVEVLWSKGFKKLPPLSPLLVKGRNLYKLKTFRQRWKSEAERLKVLDEKHKRGAAARFVRATRLMKKNSQSGSMCKGSKRQKQCHQTRPSQTKRVTKQEKAKPVDQRGKATKKTVKPNNGFQRAPPLGQVNSKQTTKFRGHNPSGGHRNFSSMDRNRAPQNFHQFQSNLEFFYHNEPHRFPLRPYDNSFFPQPLDFDQHFYPHPAYSHPSYEFEPRNFSRFPEHMNVRGPSHPFSFRGGTYKHGDY